MMHIEQIDIRDPWLQEFLWQYVVPSDIRHDYTKLDAITYIRDRALTGDFIFVGCKESRVVFRCVRQNPRILEPHIMGNGLRVRSVTRAALPMAWQLGYDKVVVWTQYPALAAAMRNIGFSEDAVIPRYHLHNGELLDMHVLSVSKEDNHEHFTPKTLLTA